MESAPKNNIAMPQSKRERLEDYLQEAQRKVEADMTGDPQARRDALMNLAKAEPTLEDQIAEARADLAEAKKKVAEAQTNAADATSDEDRKFWKHEMRRHLHCFPALENRVDELLNELDELRRRRSKEDDNLSKAAGVRGRKNIFAEKMVILLKDMDQLPPLAYLSDLLLEEMSTTLPLEPDLVWSLYHRASIHSSLKAGGDRVGFIQASSTETLGELEDYLRHVAHMDFQKKIDGGSKDQLHFVLDALVQEPLRLLMRVKGVKVELARNAKEKSKRIPSTNIDFLLYVKDLLFFRGEERSDSKDLTIAKDALKVSMPRWNPAVLGRLPYVLGYAAAGTLFQLYALHPTSEEVAPRVIMSPIGNQLDLSHVLDALTLIQYVFVIARIIVRASKEIPENVPPVGTVWGRKSGGHTQITIENEFVEKRLILDVEPRIFKWDGDGGLKELYDLVKQRRIVGTIQLQDFEVRRSEIILKLAPLGYRDPPKDASEVKKLLLDVLCALQSMHTNGWVHRDIKLANVVLRLDGQWMVIDLELASKLDKNGETDWPFWDPRNNYVYPMPPRDGEERWKPKHDIYHVAMMLKTIPVFLFHPQRNDLISALQNANDVQVANDIISRFPFDLLSTRVSF